MGFLGQFIGALRPTDRTWCCDRCKQGAVGAHTVRGVDTQRLRPGHGSRRVAESPQEVKKEDALSQEVFAGKTA